MKRKKRKIREGNQVRFQTQGPYGGDQTHTVIGKAPSVGGTRLLSLRGQDGKERFGTEKELRHATRAEKDAHRRWDKCES